MEKLSVRQIIRAKSPRVESAIPDFVIRKMEQLLCVDKINELLHLGQGMEPLDFVEFVLRRLKISYEGMWVSRLRQSRLVFASNHPFGGVDGMMLGHCIGRRFGDVRIGVNDVLMSLAPLRSIFLPINKFGRQGSTSPREFDRLFGGDIPIVTFPAGICSRRRGGVVRDEAWHAGFIKRAVMAQRDVVPVYIDGELSKRFYRLANLRRRLGIGFNVEMLRLPSELFAQQGRHYKMVFGEPIAWEILAMESSPRKQAQIVREEMERLRFFC
jgi:putative hemolysin